MTDAESFLKAILADPGNDAPRLIYADYLDDHGDGARAEFIRVGCELAISVKCESPAYTGKGVLNCAEWNARHPDRDDWCKPCGRKDALRRRERELMRRNGFIWFADLPFEAVFAEALSDHPANRTGAYGIARRGLVESMSAPFAFWLTHHAKIREACPLREVTLTTRPEIESRGWRDATARLTGCSQFRPTRGLVEDNELIPMLLKAEWPGIAFHLPIENGTHVFWNGRDYVTSSGEVIQPGRPA